MRGQDAYQDARIERKKRVEEERKARIFNPKGRILGVHINLTDATIS